MVRDLVCSFFVLCLAPIAGAKQVVHLDATVNGSHLAGQGVEVPLTAGHWSATLIEPATDPEA